MADNTTPQQGANSEGLRGSIASKVLIYGMITIGVLALTLIVTPYITGHAEGAKESVDKVFSALLPVIGTWVGTVIAFYFGKENFDAANKSVKDLVSVVTSDQKLKSIKANDPNVAIAFKDIKYYTYTNDADMAAVKLADILAFMDTNRSMRLPFINASGQIFYCIHRSVFDKFVSTLALKGTAVADLTFGDLLKTDIDEIKSYINNSVFFAKEDATLYDAKLTMDNNKYCEDIFLTKNGQKDEAVSGWITDSKLLENSKV